MIRTSIEKGNLRLEIDGRGGNAVALLTPQSALSLRSRIGDLIATLVDDALGAGGDINEVLENR